MMPELSLTTNHIEKGKIKTDLQANKNINMMLNDLHGKMQKRKRSVSWGKEDMINICQILSKRDTNLLTFKQTNFICLRRKWLNF